MCTSFVLYDVVRMSSVDGPAESRAGADGIELIAIGSDRPEGGDGVQADDGWWD